MEEKSISSRNFALRLVQRIDFFSFANFRFLPTDDGDSSERYNSAAHKWTSVSST